MMLYSFGTYNATLSYSVVLARVKKCCIVLYEMLHSLGHPSVKHD